MWVFVVVLANDDVVLVGVWLFGFSVILDSLTVFLNLLRFVVLFFEFLLVSKSVEICRFLVSS
jgi:hypothetical protein